MKDKREPTFWETLQPSKPVSPGEDLADSIALIVICALVCFMIFM